MRTRIDSRPDLCALLRNDSEAYLLLAQLHPGERPERIEGCRELCRLSVAFSVVWERVHDYS